jgi:DnaJ-class molecular chaperone
MSRAHQPRQAYLNYTVHLTLRELFKGAKRTLTVGQTHTCGKCRGARVLHETGKTCPRCDGFGFLVSYEVVVVTIPPAVAEGMTIRLEMSHWTEEERHPLHVPYSSGIFVTINVLPDPLYRVDGRDLYTTITVPVDLLETGGDWTMPAPEGGELAIKIPAHTTNGETIKIKKHGLLNGASHRRGTLFVTVLAKN